MISTAEVQNKGLVSHFKPWSTDPQAFRSTKKGSLEQLDQTKQSTKLNDNLGKVWFGLQLLDGANSKNLKRQN